MMTLLFLLLLTLLEPPTNLQVINAALVVVEPECPIAGHATCSDGIDNDADGTVDESAPSDAFLACDTDYCAEGEGGVRAGVWTTAADVTASNGNYIENPLGNHAFDGQVALCGNFTANTYYLKLVARQSANKLVWVDTSPLGLHPNNATLGGVLYNGQAHAEFDGVWSVVGNLGTANTQAKIRQNGTTQRTFALDGDECFYLMAEPDVHIDKACVTTNPASECTGGTGSVADYDILELGANAEPTPDGTVDSLWSQVSQVTFSGRDSGVTGTPIVKLVWDDTTTDRVCGLYQTTVANLEFPTTTEDNTAIGTDSAIRFNWRENTDLAQISDAARKRLIINGNATQAKMDANWPSGVFSTTFDASNLSMDRSYSADVLTIEWCMDFPALGADQLFLCDFLQQEKVTGVAYQSQAAFNSDGGDNIGEYGTCRLSSSPVPEVVDTTAPSFPDTPDCSESSTTGTSATVSCSVTEADSPPASCQVRYGTTTGVYDFTSTTSDAVGGTFTKTLSNLSAGTEYFYVVDCTDGADNTGTTTEDSLTTVTEDAFYISPTGSGTTCSNASPCALSRINASSEPRPSAGETWYLKNGTYSGSSQTINVNCASNSVNGTSTQPITIKAENERQAFLSGNGSYIPILIQNCSHWVFDGLRIKSGDTDGSSNGDPISVRGSSNLTFRNLLLTHNNRYKNSHLVDAQDSPNLLFDDNELYSFHRHGIRLHRCNGSIIRRTYCNSRNYADITGGKISHQTDRGDACISDYPVSNTIVENNISEGNEYVVEVQATDTTVNNKFYGNIALNDRYGFLVRARGASFTLMPRDTYIENFVSVGATFHGLFARSTKNTQCVNCASFASGSGGFVADFDENTPGDGAPTFFSDNALAIGNSGTGFLMDSQSSFGIDYPHSSSNGINYNPAATHANITNEVTSAPTNLGNCKVRIPPTSNLSGAGLGGADIGANVIYQYVDGALTSMPLWDAGNGYRFTGCGATVAGVNDTAGNSCINVHQRLDVGAAEGCALPY